MIMCFATADSGPTSTDPGRAPFRDGPDLRSHATSGTNIARGRRRLREQVQSGGEIQREPSTRRGRDHFDIAWRLALYGWLGCVLLQLALYLRPGPYGGPFLLEWQRYFGLSLYFDLLGVWLLAFPFFLVWLLLWRRPLGPRWAALHHAQLLLLTANLALSQFDHEMLRFFGARLNFSFLAIYARPGTLSDSLFQDVLSEDRGGPLLPLVLFLLAPAIYLLVALRLIRTRRRTAGKRRPIFWLALAIAVLPLAAPANGWAKATSKFRLRKTEPVILALATDFRLGFDDLSEPSDLPALAAAYQNRWLAESGDSGWRFADPRRPYVRAPIGPPPPLDSRPWNVIYLQLESFRGVDMGFLGREGRSPTPFLDSLAASPNAGVWTRASSFGMPTINGIFATHCSVAPHSRRFITSFTPTSLYCLPEALRRRGYRAEMFNAGDTDWDNSTMWLNRWYDRLWRFPEANQKDRPVFRAAAERIRALGRSGRPFFAAVVSVSNHTPFTAREAGFEVSGRDTPRERILNTTNYTDDVVREFIEALRREPWLEHTVIVIVGDHGFNLGEHPVPPGQISLYREAVWVPLLILGSHPRLAAGRHDETATLLDVAPTIAELVGVREPVPWQGHSLIGSRPGRLFAFAINEWRLGENESWSSVDEPGADHPRLFDRRLDWRQTRDRSPEHRALADSLVAKAEANRRLNDYLLRHDLIWRRPDS